MLRVSHPLNVFLPLFTPSFVFILQHVAIEEMLSCVILLRAPWDNTAKGGRSAAPIPPTLASTADNLVRFRPWPSITCQVVGVADCLNTVFLSAILCLACRFCLSPEGIQRHLKRHRQRIYRPITSRVKATRTPQPTKHHNRFAICLAYSYLLLMSS